MLAYWKEHLREYFNLEKVHFKRKGSKNSAGIYRQVTGVHFYRFSNFDQVHGSRKCSGWQSHTILSETKIFEKIGIVEYPWKMLVYDECQRLRYLTFARFSGWFALAFICIKSTKRLKSQFFTNNNECNFYPARDYSQSPISRVSWRDLKLALRNRLCIGRHGELQSYKLTNMRSEVRITVFTVWLTRHDNIPVGVIPKVKFVLYRTKAIIALQT